MKKDLLLWQYAGFVFTSAAGTLLHFLYDWTGGSLLSAPFSAVNESTWEHMKLMYFPMLIFALIQSRFFRERKDFWCVKLAGIVTGLTLIPVLFYTLGGVFGATPDWVNIAIFFISAAIAFIVEARLFERDSTPCRASYLALAAIILIGVLFVVFTFATPQIPLFLDPISGSYGVGRYKVVSLIGFS